MGLKPIDNGLCRCLCQCEHLHTIPYNPIFIGLGLCQCEHTLKLDSLKSSGSEPLHGPSALAFHERLTQILLILQYWLKAIFTKISHHLLETCVSPNVYKKSTFLEWYYLQPVRKQYILDRQGTISLNVIEAILNGTLEKRTGEPGSALTNHSCSGHSVQVLMFS